MSDWGMYDPGAAPVANEDDRLPEGMPVTTRPESVPYHRTHDYPTDGARRHRGSHGHMSEEQGVWLTEPVKDVDPAYAIVRSTTTS
jgi:hypothetical protein